MQYDFLPGGALAVQDGDEIIPVINRIQSDFDLVVATQDWHPKGHHSFSSTHPGSRVFNVISLHGNDQVLWPDHCVQGSKGAELTDLLNWERVSAIFRKGMDVKVDSYSGFLIITDSTVQGWLDIFGNWMWKKFMSQVWPPIIVFTILQEMDRNWGSGCFMSKMLPRPFPKNPMAKHWRI